MASPVPVVAVRGSTGISINLGPPNYDPVTAFQKDDSKSCKCMLFSPDSSKFAWVNGISVKIVSTSTWKLLAEIPHPKVSCLKFSPKGTYLMTWEPCITTTAGPGGPNLHIFKSENGELVKDFIHKKQTGWEPQWSQDEKLCGRCVNDELLFYEDGKFDSVALRVRDQKIANFALAPGTAPYHALCYMPGKSGTPSFGRLFQYPKFENQNSLANRSFFQADRVEMFWNCKATGALLLASTDVDKTGSSYYGKQTLHFLSNKESALVVLGKEGPIYSVQWSPKGTEFCVCYGFMPAKVTLYNLKVEPVFEFGTGPRNAIHYNPTGNILILGGFGNLRGGVEVWDAPQRKLITKLEAPDTTLLEWSPDGKHFMTATTAPRLRMGNGFKIWHYSGALMYERPWNKQEELWEVLWQSFPSGVFKEPSISYKAVEGIQPTQPTASKQVYRPPSARGKESNFKLHDEEPPHKPGESPALAASNTSKATLKLKKKREAKKAKKAEQTQGDTVETAVQSNPAVRDQKPPATNGISSLIPADSEIDDPEKLKKLKKIKSKLDQINRLKEQLASGKQLEINQLDKIKKEDELLKELKDLAL
ncbi:Eukaryotic translation initiation factor 2A [Frankliniella fusca]|uniref:Eukaryotic translation initiation factor 2A n=1 Tax=Frankliniella fusca TaxID=407009 RepID=A0AAE1GRR9_9NEOP|nr:Eukaryotic translation initiation factor 2A [Frankliniella fusca]